MSGGGEFEDKANRLMNRLGSISKLNWQKPREDNQPTSSSLGYLRQMRQQLVTSDGVNLTQLSTLNQNLSLIQQTLKLENENRLKIDETFSLTLLKLEKNMRNILTSMGKAFADRQNKLSLKIETLIKAERKQLDDQYSDIDEHLQAILKLQKKVGSIIEEVAGLRKTRGEFEERICLQFGEQTRQLKRMLQLQMKRCEQRQLSELVLLKGIYRSGMQGMLAEERQRQQSQKMLIVVVEQLVNQIMQV